MRGTIGGKVILVVDDEAFARLLAVQVLLDEGYTVLEAADAGEALDMLERNDDVALLFTDISMPGDMDGLGLIETVRRTRPYLPVVAASGFSRPREGALPADAIFLPKPYIAHHLCEAIRIAGAA